MCTHGAIAYKVEPDPLIHVKCRTNLDLAGKEIWPEILPCRPMVGDLIQSYYSHRGTHLELQVVRVKFVPCDMVTWKYFLEVELHLPPHRFASIEDFQKWDKERQ